MTRRNFKIYLSLSTTFLSHNPTPISPFHNFSLPTLPSIFTRLLTTSPPPTDNLDGLFDPEFNHIEDSRVQFSLDQELAILRDSMLDPPHPDIEPKIESLCKSTFSDDAYLISNAIKNNNDGFADKTQKFLRQFREKLSESLVVDVLKLVQNAELGVKFFKWAGRQIGYSHTLAVYNVLLDVLGCGGNDDWRVSDHLLREIKDDDANVPGKLLNVLIRKFCRNVSWNAALEELGRLRDFGYKPSRATYNALVRVFVEVDKIDTAYLVQREMADMGYRMDAHTLGCFTSSLCKIGRSREALDLIEKEEFSPDTILYTRMISGLCEGSYFVEAMEFLNRMRASSCIPNVVTYRTSLFGV